MECWSSSTCTYDIIFDTAAFGHTKSIAAVLAVNSSILLLSVVFKRKVMFNRSTLYASRQKQYVRACLSVFLYPARRKCTYPEIHHT